MITLSFFLQERVRRRFAAGSRRPDFPDNSSRSGNRATHGIYGRVDQRPAVACVVREAGVFQFLEVKRQRGGRQAELFTDVPGWQAISARLDKQTVDIEASFL